MSREKVQVRPEMLIWACERSGKSAESIANRFPKFDDWCRGEASPTFKQLESFAKATYTFLVFFFSKVLPKSIFRFLTFELLEMSMLSTQVRIYLIPFICVSSDRNGITSMHDQ